MIERVTYETAMTPKLTAPCIVCGAVLENLVDDGNHPLEGLAFVTEGHYGSTEFDPMDGTALIVNICDSCLERERKEKNGSILYFDGNAKPSYSLWTK